MSNIYVRYFRVVGLVFLGLALLILWIGPYFSGTKLINPIFLYLGGWQIHWYGLLMVVAVVAGWYWLDKLAKRTYLVNKTLDLIVWVALGGLVGARLLFVLLKLSEFSGQWQSIFSLSQGGLSIHGALIGGLVATFIYCRHNQLSFSKTLDMLVLPVLIGQVIGRWGNFFNQEAFGGPTNLVWKMYVAPKFRPEGYANYNFFHPTFLYEAIGLGLIIWLIIRLRKQSLSAGTLTIIYLISYSVLRFGIEFFRLDSDKLWQLTLAQWGSLLIIMGGVIIGLILKKKRL